MCIHTGSHKHIFSCSVSLSVPKRNDAPEATSTPSTEILVSDAILQ